MTKNQIISARILDGVSRGLSLPQAFDAVMGEGAYRRFCDEIYAELNA